MKQKLFSIFENMSGIKKYGWLIFLGLQVCLLSILKFTPEVVETFYSNGVYIIISKLMRYSFGWLPFSVGDVLYTLTGIYIIRWCILNFKRIYRDFLQWILDVTAMLSIVYFAFHVLWGFNYYRQPLHTALKIDDTYTTEALVSFTQRLISTCNTIHSEVSLHDTLKVTLPYTKPEIFEKAIESYQSLNAAFPDWEYQPTSLKTSLYSLALTYMGFSGYINPFTNEAQVDALIPSFKYPTTSCHEIAHQIGYAAENEANFIGCLATLHHEDNYIKYSGYSFALRYCLNEIYRREPKTYKALLPTINKGILKNYKEVREFWKGYKTPLKPFFKSTYDSFLKTNNQSDGTKSYSYVVALLVNYFKDKPLT